jgi:prepilin-type N-terminal cleavage/methylation domain-containing protein
MPKITTERQTPPRNGFTMPELMIGLVIAAVCILAASGVLAGDQRAWLGVYDRAYSNVAAGADVARRRFDTLVHKGSKTNSQFDSSGAWIEVRYCAEESSSAVDRYARFYVAGGSLKVDYGPLSPRTTDTTEVLCGNVTNCLFLHTGTSAQMVLTLNDGSHSATVTPSAVMHVR